MSAGRGIIRGLKSYDAPLCFAPANSIYSAAHEAANRVLDRLHDALPKDAEGDLLEGVADGGLNPADLYREVAGEDHGRMYLHEDAAMWWEGLDRPHAGRQLMAKSYYFRCHLCGWQIPATIEQVFPKEATQ